MSFIRQVLAACLLASWVTLVVSTEASERQSESVQVTFYQLSTSEWSSVETSFKTLVAAEAMSYCGGSNAASCGLVSGDQFTASEVGVADGPTEDSKSLKITFYIDYPVIKTLTSTATTTYVVNSAAVKTILTNIHDSLEGAVGADITYIGSDYYSVAPAATLNKVLIPIAFILLLAIIILAVALHMWNKRKEEEEKKKRKALDREIRKKNSRITPMYTMESEAITNWTQMSRKKKQAAQETGDSTRATNGKVATLPLKTSMLTYNSGRSATPSPTKAAAHGEDPAPLRASGLPPLPVWEEETKGQQEESKREKKEKKRRKREKRQRSAKSEAAPEESESEYSKTESLEKQPSGAVVPVEDELQVVA